MAAGAVVARDVFAGDVVAGVPARPIGKVEDFVRRWQEETDQLPWAHLVQARAGGFDPHLGPELVRLRVEHFYGGHSS